MNNLTPGAAGSGIRALVQRGKDLLGGGSLRGRIMRNTGWLAIGFAAEVVIRLGASLVLTRLLAPDAYGLISTVTVLMVFVTMLSDLGIKTMVIADDRGDDPNFLSTLWTMQVIRGFLIGALAVLASFVWMYAIQQKWIAPSSSYGDPVLPQLMLLISVTLVLAGFSSLNEFRLIRHLERSAITRMEIAYRLLGTAFTIGFAIAFRSVWAMALGTVMGGIARVAMTHWMLAGPPMRLRFNWGEIGKVLSVSRWVALNSLMTVIMSQADKVLIGLAFGMQTLGVYSIAFALYLAAATVVDQLNSSLGLPVIRALMEKPEAEREQAYYRYRLPLDLYCAVAGTGMVLFGAFFFRLAYPTTYETGGVFFALFGLKILLTPMVFSGNFLFAQLRYKLASTIGFFRTAIAIGAMALAAWLDSIHLMVAVVALSQLPEVLAYFALRRTGIPFRMKHDGALLALTAVMGLCVALQI